MTGRLTPYRPAKGAEGDAFHASLCARCRQDASESVRCTLLIRGLMLRGVQLFPGEWVLSDGVPSCSAFVPMGGRYRHPPPAPVPASEPQMELAI